MAVNPAPPARTRAVIVGLEDYSELGEGFHLAGSLVDAERMHEVLVDFGVPPKRITTFIAPRCKEKIGMAGARAFSRAAIDQFFEEELAKDEHNGTLIVCWSGHGSYVSATHSLHLLTPDATREFERSIDFHNLAEMLIGKPFARFTHQVLIVSTCRSPPAAAPAPLVLAVVPPDPFAETVRQCQLFACAEGRTAHQDSTTGSRLVRILVERLREAKAHDTTAWPDFVELAARTRDAVSEESKGFQHPAVHATGWDRGLLPLIDGRREVVLPELLARWPAAQRRVQGLRCLGADSPAPSEAVLGHPRRLVEFLLDLPQLRGWSPLVEFAARLHATAPADEAREALSGWLAGHASEADRAAVATHLETEPSGHVLQLWHDGSGALKAALFDPDDRLVVRFAGREEAVAIGAGGLDAAISAWVHRAHESLGAGQPLAIELCVPEAELANDHDRLTLAVGGAALVLNRDIAVLLRCVDRLKVAPRSQQLARIAPAILLRAAHSRAPIRWAAPGAGRTELLRGLFAGGNDTPAWIGLPAPPAHAAPLRICLDGLAPALFWLRPDVPPEERATVEKELIPLLREAATGLPHRLLDWRRDQIGCASEQVALLLDDPARTPPWIARFGVAASTSTAPGKP